MYGLENLLPADGCSRTTDTHVIVIIHINIKNQLSLLSSKCTGRTILIHRRNVINGTNFHTMHILIILEFIGIFGEFGISGEGLVANDGVIVQIECEFTSKEGVLSRFCKKMSENNVISASWNIFAIELRWAHTILVI